MKNIRTKNLIHSGEILREEFMKPLNISQNALAIAMHVPATRIGEIVNEKKDNCRYSITSWSIF